MFEPGIRAIRLLNFTRGVNEQGNFFAENRRVYLGRYMFNVGVQGSDLFSEGRGEHAIWYLHEGGGDNQAGNIPLKKTTTSKGLCEKDVEDSSYHCYWIAYFECCLEKEVRYEPMYAFQTRECL